MDRTRVGAIIPMGDGFALMHRTNVKHKIPQNYYAFPGGGVEENETLEQATIREIEEEFGIQVEVIRLLYEAEIEIQKEYFYLCKYISGQMGTGTGPEFNNDPAYVANGNYIPEIISREEIKDIVLLPPQIRDRFIIDLEKREF